MKKRIDKYIAKSSLIKIYVDVEGEEDEYRGIPIRRSRTLLALHKLDEFHFNGYIVVRLKDVVKIKRGRVEVTKQRILKATGVLDTHVGPDWLRVGSWKSILTCLKRRGVCVCVGSALIKVDVFAIGDVHKLKDNAVVLNSFDAHGKWYKPKHKIKYSDITGIFFGDKYSVTFSEYVKRS